jgi:hypothetical protein
LEVETGFLVYRDSIRSGFTKCFYVFVCINDHQMGVEWELRHLSDGGNDHRPEGDIRDEATIHDIQMDPIRSPFFSKRDLFTENREIGCEDRWSDVQFGHGTF